MMTYPLILYVHAAHFCASTKNRVRHEVGRPNERAWNPKPPFSGEILHCQQYSLPLEKLFSVYLYVCGCVCTQIYNIYHWGQTETWGRHRRADIMAFFQSLQIICFQYLFYSIFMQKRLFSLWKKRRKCCLLEGTASLFLFSQIFYSQSHILFGKANNSVINGVHFSEDSLMFFC